ncbi:Gfo/Idh/MocA family protein [Pelagicoccus mobilis]|uniref:Gfo/Idh/MocA family oxidoreductase n=1 Tax=Pelagicoccus mobilis TaxID=415221 RepID=A0A934RX38_9BACT|nr:Gfo/Idh/MocA family oxidoreductase [Pelagicoccus mobilis]MBK1875982.1 Gfo/Idh/MocA family oxidoreductase [Pelagicoccus mobilis]
MSNHLTRRQAIKGLASVAAFSILPSSSFAKSAPDKLRIAQIGVGNQGFGNLNNLLRLKNAEVVALADVDSNFLGKASTLVPKAQTYRDYRVLFDKMADQIDAVLVSTPDHMHAPIAMAAMDAGKHVYCEKPLAHNVVENRELRIKAEETELVTQLGIQVSASIGQRMTVEYLRNGIIGKVSEVHVWSNKAWGLSTSDYPNPTAPVPDTLDWNLWLGVAKERPFRKDTFHPFAWRRLLDFGTGTLGDMGVHIFDTPYRALELGDPLSVRTQCKNFNNIAHPEGTVTEYQFPATRFTTEKLKWTWYDGKYAPPKIEGLELEEGNEMPDQGCVLVGEKGMLMMPHQAAPQTFPKELIRSVPRPKIKPRNHHGEWVDACLGKGKTNSPFSYGGPLCETLQIGVVASRFPGETLEWDPEAMRIKNIKEANQYLSREYREF